MKSSRLIVTEELIRSVSFFNSLPDGEIEKLLGVLGRTEAPANTLLVKENEKGDRYFILVEGEVEVIKALGTADERLLGVRVPNSLIGEMSLFSKDGRHTASVRARTPLKLLELSHGDLDDLLHRQPSFAYELIRTMSQRLDESENLTIIDLRQKNQELMRANAELQSAQAQLIEKEKLEKELEVARDIQRNILPHQLPQIPDLDLGANIAPMATVGGDFYDFIALGDETLGIAVGDVTDHGIPAALLMALTATLLRVESRRADSPAIVLRELNRLLLEMSQPDMFVTLLYGLLNRNARTFTYARAGHELPQVLSPQGEWLPIAILPGQPLGLFDEPVLDEQAIELPPGSLLVLYTDGAPNTLNPRRQMIGLEEMKNVIAEESNRPAQELCDQVIETLFRYRDTMPASDDITLVTVKVT